MHHPKVMRARGFTLIEILVVLLIMGITLRFALLSFGDFGEKRRIITMAEQCAQNIQFLQQQALIQSQTLGITVQAHGYTVMSFNPDTQQWVTIQGAQHSYPPNVILHLQARQNTPIVINPLGEVSAFRLDFGTSSHPPYARVIGTQHQVQWTPAP